MNIFITGGTGFIGRQLVLKLEKTQHSLLLLTRNRHLESNRKVRYLIGNLHNIRKWQSEFMTFKPDIVIHLAWEGLPDHHADISKTNLDFGLDLVQLSAKLGCKLFISTGSGWEYGIQSGKLSENNVSVPFDAFTAAKHALNGLGWEIAKENGMSFVWLRPFFVYGPGQRPLALIPSLLNSIAAGKTPEIRNPDAANDFIYVTDVAKAILLTIRKCLPTKSSPPTYYVYNVGSGKLTKVSYIINHIYKKFRLKNNYKQVAKQFQDNITHSYADISQIEKGLGWKPETNIIKGIDKTIDYFLKSTSVV